MVVAVVVAVALTLPVICVASLTAAWAGLAVVASAVVRHLATATVALLSPTAATVVVAWVVATVTPPAPPLGGKQSIPYLLGLSPYVSPPRDYVAALSG